MEKFVCPICKEQLNLSELDKTAMEPAKSISCYQYSKQCNKCKAVLYFDSQHNAFKKLSLWKRLLNKITLSDLYKIELKNKKHE